jgi:predicted hydrocarbon binding protein
MHQMSYLCCHLSTGLLYEALNPVRGDKGFGVKGTTFSLGDTTCTFEVSERSLDRPSYDAMVS